MKKVLFLCTENSARSQMAEAILNMKGKGHFAAYSAGSRPAESINPYAKLVMEEIGIDTVNCRPKPVKEFLDEEFDFVITLCDKAKQECAVLNPNAIHAHWGLADPKHFEGTEEEVIKQFRMIRNELISRINIMLSLPYEKLDGAAVKSKLNDILSSEIC